MFHQTKSNRLPSLIKKAISYVANFRYGILAWLALFFSLAIVCYSWQQGGIVRVILGTDIPAAIKIEKIKQFFESFGKAAPLVYVLCVTIEVMIAPLPGLMLYGPGGFIFRFPGACCLFTGNTLGSGVCCAALRSLGSNWMRRFFSEHKITSIQERLERHGVWLIFLLRVNPLTSSDLVSYAAGLTRIPIWKVMTATAFGMAPLCFAQAYFVEGVMQRYPWLLYPLIGFLCHLFVRFSSSSSFVCGKSIHQITQDISKIRRTQAMPFWSVMSSMPQLSLFLAPFQG